MAKYLDQTGLKYFWGKIKAKIPGPLQAYPVGSIYLSFSSNFNPNTSFGGTWSKIAEGQCLIQAGNNYALGSTGGESTHTLTVSEMPTHHHAYKLAYGDHDPSHGFDYGTGYVGTFDDGDFSGSAGGNQAHNNMPPYLAVNIWKRTA